MSVFHVSCYHKFLRSEFISALRVSVLPLTALLRRESESEEGELCGVWRVLLVLGKVGACEGQYSTLCQILGNLLTAFFCLARRTTDVSRTHTHTHTLTLTLTLIHNARREVE